VTERRSWRERSLLLWALPFLRPYRWPVAALAALSLLEVVLGALAPWPLKAVVDNVLGARPLPAGLQAFVDPFVADSRIRLLGVVLVAGVVLQLTSQLVSMLHTQVQVETGQRMVLDLRQRLFSILQALPLRHHAHASTGDAVYRLESDAYCIDNLVMKGVFPLASAIATLVVMFAILMRLDPTVALLSLIVVPFLYAALRYYMKHMVDRAEHVRELESGLMERLYETFAGIKLVKSFAREPFELAKFTAFARRTLDARVDLTWQESLFSVVVSGITIIGTAIVVGFGGLAVMRGTMTVGGLIVVVAYLQAVYGPLSSIAHTTGSLQQAFVSARRVRDMFGQPLEDHDVPGAREADAVQGHVRFDNVSFGYTDSSPVLSDVTFEAHPGQMIAIVGLTGAGKTTLVSLIPRLYDATGGRVVVDGLDVRNYRLRSLRGRIAIVLQEPMLFSGSLADNIRYGRPEATDDEVEAAARAAYAHDFISRQAQGYATDVAEAGKTLSGGERQRISIARALLKDAPILILDEPTSSLDAISEAAVFSALKTLRQGRTTLVIAHRLSTIRDADAILVLDGGRLVARGTHDELLASNGLYRRMCARLSVGRSLDEPETVDELIRAAR
jgi:ATP-binding cassette subfamily B protein/subfamily B ATP-binding cassette protein MsbA